MIDFSAVVPFCDIIGKNCKVLIKTIKYIYTKIVNASIRHGNVYKVVGKAITACSKASTNITTSTAAPFHIRG